MIFFAKNIQTSEILIAYSQMPKQRLADLQRKSRERLELLGAIYGDYEDKVDLHHRFHRFNLDGDWFKGDILRQVRVIIGQNSTDGPPPINVIVAGDSDFADRHFVMTSLHELHRKTPFGCINVGGERPFERWAVEWAVQNEVAVRAFHPEWSTKGRFAGFKVGPQMLRARFDNKMLVVFLAEKTSPSVAKLIRQAEKLGIEVVTKPKRKSQ